ncbi:hypothetical protein [Streptomyces aidingensis]|uniref:DUF4412 domain-containing protein n=1 Tax=Streptomyces aidingensis TaxID=910347 RepID=A0A1I1EXQ8_9ACTN|nr:hypothetical protein [Streptomyces aidingensis]SFB91757.1 hypothetical protein SAMN05421773_101512 [Streptomyces aidingensis]
MQSLTSVTMKGEINQSDGSVMEIDLSMSTDGECRGTIVFDGAGVRFIQVDGSAYMQADDAFWSEQSGGDGAAINDLLADRWARMPSEQGMGEMCDLNAFLEDLDEDGDDKEPQVSEGEKIDGKATVKLTTVENDETTNAYIADYDDAYILRMVKEDGDEPGQIDFTDFNKKFDIKAPSEDESVDFEALQQQ